jgi:hypothetical protein
VCAAFDGLRIVAVVAEGFRGHEAWPWTPRLPIWPGA